MTLKDLSWEQYSVYLFSDRKLKRTNPAVYSYRSRFFSLKKYFSDVDFNRHSFTEFLSEREKTNKPAYLNNFIKTALHLDRYLLLNFGLPRQLDEFPFYTVIDEAKEVLSPEEVNRLINVYVPHPKRTPAQNIALRAKYRRILTFLWVTGCRVGEAIALSPRDIMADHVIFRDTKSNHPRPVPLDSDFAQDLKENSQGNSVFGYKYEKQLGIELKKRAALCGIKKNVHPHIFRYSFITEMLNHADIEDVGKIVGHKDPATTQRYNQVYMHKLQSAIAHHPYYREKQTVDTLAKQVRAYLNGIVDTSRFPIPSEQSITALFKPNENNNLRNN